jgi:hypothetical protein
VSGEGGIYLINWTKDVAPHLLLDDDDDDDDTARMVQNKKKKKKRKAFDPSINVNIVRHLKPHASTAAAWNDGNDNDLMVEINDFALDHDNTDPYHIYGAAGDAFGCYKWNLERGEVVATYRPQNNNHNGLSRKRNGNSGYYCNGDNYLHTVNMTTSHPHAILLGGENGTLELWDTHADQRIEAWSMGSTTTDNDDGSSSSGWVGSSAMAGDWWHVGGGRGGSNSSGESAGGFVASFHGPTRSLVTNRTTPEVIQYLQYDAAATTLYSVGNESFVSRWDDPCILRQRQKIGCSTASGFATAVLLGSASTSTTMGLVAVAGTGSTVDLFDRSTAMPFCQFHIS